MNNNIFGKRLKLLRENANMSRIELSYHLSTSVSAISLYENGNRVPSDDIKIAIAKLFNVSLDYLMGLKSLPNDTDSSKILSELANMNDDDVLEIIHFIQFLKSKHK